MKDIIYTILLIVGVILIGYWADRSNWSDNSNYSENEAGYGETYPY